MCVVQTLLLIYFIVGQKKYEVEILILSAIALHGSKDSLARKIDSNWKGYVRRPMQVTRVGAIG